MATQEQQIQQEAAELTPAQQAQAATEAVNATNDLVKAADPLTKAVVGVFVTTLKAAPELFVPALTTLLRSPFPLPPALKTQLRTIIARARSKTPAKAPATPTRQRRTQQTAPTPVAKSKFPVIPVVAGVAAAGILGVFILKRK